MLAFIQIDHSNAGNNWSQVPVVRYDFPSRKDAARWAHITAQITDTIVRLSYPMPHQDMDLDDQRHAGRLNGRYYTNQIKQETNP